ncbi:hypothetical protein ACQ4OB_00410 [Pseudomonas sp. ES4]|uniref:hypothetical protein n=1 Tax=Pseudomonas sp. ES4 TaxID=3424777 RepID=UPI003D33BEFF
MSTESKQINFSTWYQEFMPYVNGQRIRWDDLDLKLFAGGVCELKLDYEYSWLIGDPDAQIALEYQPGNEGQGLVFDPPLGQLVEMAEGTTSLSWTIKATAASSGSFALQFAMPQFVEVPKSPPLPGAILDFAQELEAKYDEFPVPFGANAYPCHGAKHTFTVLPKPGSQWLNKKIRLLMRGENLGVVVSPSLESEQLLTPEGVMWELDCLGTTQKGSFSLQVMLVEFEGNIPPLNMLLAHNLVTAEHWITGPHWAFPDLEYYLWHVRATSVFLKTLAPGVATMYENGTPSNSVTGKNGEDSSRVSYLKIVNRYDGSVV